VSVGVSVGDCVVAVVDVSAGESTGSEVVVVVVSDVVVVVSVGVVVVVGWLELSSR
jgi:hypothetical protein